MLTSKLISSYAVVGQQLETDGDGDEMDNSGAEQTYVAAPSWWRLTDGSCRCVTSVEDSR